MKVNTIEHRPHTTIALDNDSIGIMIDVTDKGVSVSIENNDTSINYMFDHGTAREVSSAIIYALDHL